MKKLILFVMVLLSVKGYYVYANGFSYHHGYESQCPGCPGLRLPEGCLTQ